MYKCDDCGREFEEPATYEDDPSPAGISLPAGHYTYEMCPYCESEYFTEITDDEEELPEDVWGTDAAGNYLYEDEDGNLMYEDGTIHKTALQRQVGLEYIMEDVSTSCRKIFERKKEEIRTANNPKGNK